jgi:HEAT repeat protein
MRVLEAVLICGVAFGALTACRTGIDDRIEHVYALARHPSERNKDRIAALLGDPDRDVRATVLVVMNGVDSERAYRMATDSLRDRDGLVRAAAVSIVGEHPGPSTTRALLDLAGSDTAWQVRGRALEAIASSEDPAVAEAFERALADSVRHVRKTALRVGVERPGLLPTERLSEVIASDPDWENRVEAARALGVSKDPAAYAGLEAALADPNEFVRAAASAQRRALQTAGVARPD